MPKRRGYSIHHILPRSMGWSNEKDNLLSIKDNTHRALHTLFDNQMIAQQLITTVWLSEKALRDDVKNRLIDTLTSLDIEDPYARYKEECIK